MLSAGTAVISLHGASCLVALITIFEGHLGQPSLASEADDYIKEAVVILFGRVARHLQASDPRIPAIEPRQGVMFAFETLSNTLGRLFEPYVTYAHSCRRHLETRCQMVARRPRMLRA